MSAPSQQYQPAPYAQQPASIATASVVLGAVGFVVGICSVIGLILGVVARGKVKRGEISPARVTAGIVVSAVSLGLGIIGWIVVIALVGSTAATTSGLDVASQPSITVEESAAAEVTPAEEPVEAAPAVTEDAPEPVQESAPVEAATPVADVTVAQENAVRSAEDYLDFTAFSRSGLVKQLEFEGFSSADATYAVDNITVDYNEQAAISAKQYLEYSSFSRQSLTDQLLFEGYTASEAEYGVSQTGL